MHTPVLTLLVTSVKKFSHHIIRDFSELEFLASNKESANKFATDSTTKLQQNLYNDLKNFKPNYSFYFSNLPNILNRDTSNFFYIHGIMGFESYKRASLNFGIAISLFRDNKIFAGVIYNPISGDLFFAEHNEGAFYKQKRLHLNNLPYTTKEHSTLLMSYDSKALEEDKEKISNAIYTFNGNPALEIGNFAANKLDKISFKNNYIYNDLAFATLLAKESGVILKYTINDKFITNIYNE